MDILRPAGTYRNKKSHRESSRRPSFIFSVKRKDIILRPCRLLLFCSSPISSGKNRKSADRRVDFFVFCSSLNFSDKNRKSADRRVDFFVFCSSPVFMVKIGQLGCVDFCFLLFTDLQW